MLFDIIVLVFAFPSINLRFGFLVTIHPSALQVFKNHAVVFFLVLPTLLYPIFLRK